MITLVLSIVHRMALRVLFPVAILALVINVTWTIVQLHGSCRWSVLQFDGGETRRSLPRWAFVIPLGFIYFDKAVLIAFYGVRNV